jgi:hypothetical protein
MTAHLRLALVGLALGCGCSSGSGGGGMPAGPQSYTVEFGPIVVPAGVEHTQCIVKRLGNPMPLHVGTVHNILGEASHHMVVYRVADTVEQPTPFDCEPFRDTLRPGVGSPMMITQKKDDRLQLPDGVAYTLDANQMLRIELHYLNATSADVMLTASTTMTEASHVVDDANFLLIGDPDIVIPSGQDVTLGPVFYQLDATLADIKFFALTGHEHRLGTNVTIAAAADANDAGTMVYDVPNWSWSEPATVVHDPPFTVPAGGGFRFTCTWHNPNPDTSAPPVTFGESATDEMCFFWAYYYPSHGTHVCLHTDRNGMPTDHCLQ